MEKLKRSTESRAKSVIKRLNKVDRINTLTSDTKTNKSIKTNKTEVAKKTKNNLKKVKQGLGKIGKYKMKINEFMFIYNLYNFEIQNKRPKNDLKIYYFIKPDWIKTFKIFFKVDEIYKILDDNIKNEYFLNIIKAENIPEEFSKIKCKNGYIPEELYDFEYCGEYLINLNEEDTKIAYYPFKVFILEESMNNAFDINGKSFKFEKGKQGIILKNTFYAVIDDKILEVFTYNEKIKLFEPLCLFYYNYKYDLYKDLNNIYKYKEIKECLEEMDFAQKPYPTYIRDSNQNVTGKIVYLIGDDAPNNINSFIEENKKEYDVKEAYLKELQKKIREERMRETKKILTEEKLKEKERKKEAKKEKEEIKKRLKEYQERIKEEKLKKEYEETIRNKKYKERLKKEKEKELIENEIKEKEMEERMEKERIEKEKMDEIEKENERLNQEKIMKEREDIIRAEKEKLEKELKENEERKALKLQREKELYKKIQEETKKLDEEKSLREKEKRAKEEAKNLRIEKALLEEEEKEKKIKAEKELKKAIKKNQREAEKKRIREGFERLEKTEYEEKKKEEYNKLKIRQEIKEKREKEKKYWEKIKQETDILERERIKREQEKILRQKIIEDTKKLESEQKLTKEEQKIKNEEKRIREEKELNKILKKENDKKIKIKTKENIKNKEKNKSNDIIIINNKKETIHNNKNKNISSLEKKPKSNLKKKEDKKIHEQITTDDDRGSEVDIRFRKYKTQEDIEQYEKNKQKKLEQGEDYDEYAKQKNKIYEIETEKEKEINEDKQQEIEYNGKEQKIGLKNVQAVCYMNATLQCFNKTKELSNYFLRPENKSRILLNNSIIKNENNLELTTSYYEVLQNLWNAKNKTGFYSPYNFKERIKIMNPLFQGYNSGEPKDLIDFILLKLHEELNVVKKSKKEDKDKLHSKYNQYDRFYVLSEFLEDNKIKNNGIISDLFYGVTENISECLVCKENNKKKGINRKFKYEFKNIKYFIFPLEEIRKYRNNKFLKINANVMTPNMMTDILNNNRVFIMDCFEYYQNSKILDGENKLYCEVCNKKTNANFRTKIYYPPNIMILILDRGINIKYKVGIDFVTSIDITQFVDKEYTVDAKFEYELYGVITFIGESSKTGKYIAFCRTHDDKRKWVCYNDDNVSDIIDFISQVHNYGLPCVLFYEKINA